ncbi:protein FAR1-RELATED SEQUENCE 7-like [Silene latifolia]|uniref:protein FAR1-RELATED SEQUENCE 7-like n=1 Tax=Silene latifolia TaxID=37657 RepID=UPI003D76B5DD
MAVNRPWFFFDFDVDSDGSLSKAIWADGIARRNYSIFGDAVSFDPTYSTNKYDMVFTPFTGVDHHKRSVTFCGALVAHEDAESFQWVFSRFLLRWVGRSLSILSPIRMLDEDIKVAEFDAKWEEIGREHTVNNIDWFKEMYAKRKQWVMAHCKDLEMGGKKLDNSNRHTSPKISTHLAIEVHGAQVYSHKEFEKFQEEVKYSIDTCKSRGFSKADSLEVTTVRDANRDRNYQVTYCPVTFKATCSCRMLEKKGILCRHVIWIYSSNGVKKIPELCVVNRWCKDAIRSKMFDGNGEVAEDVDIIDGKQIAMSVMWSEIHQTVVMLRGKFKADVDNFSSLIREFKEKLSPLGSQLNKQQQLEEIFGYSASQEITILPPKQSKNKGSGKRVLSLKAKAVALASKSKCMCKNCKRLANHNKRNCPNPFADNPPLSPSSEESSEEEEEEVEEEEDDILE